jgi:hypothetical protein
MLRLARSWCLLVLVAAASLTAGYVLPRPRPPKKGADMLDAVAAVLRRRPLHLAGEPAAPYSWEGDGGVYLSRTYKTSKELDYLIKDAGHYDDGWKGVVYFKVCSGRGSVVYPFLPADGEHALDYGEFAVYGDPELVQEVRVVLADQGYEAAAP